MESLIQKCSGLKPFDLLIVRRQPKIEVLYCVKSSKIYNLVIFQNKYMIAGFKDRYQRTFLLKRIVS